MTLSFDISRCRNEICPSRNQCQRHLDKGHPTYQVFSIFKPDEDGYCADMIKVEKEMK